MTQASSETAGSTKATKDFLGPGGVNYQAKFGHVSSPEEFEEAAGAVEDNVQARGEHDWARQCRTFTDKVLTAIAEFPKAEERRGCGAQLALQGEKAPPYEIEDNIAGSVAVFRVEGNKGFALYHGTDRINWAMPMQREGGEWKVAALSAERLPRVEQSR